MAKLPLGDNPCRTMLKKEWAKYEKKQGFTQEQSNEVGFWGDVSNDETYTWKAYIPHLNKSVAMTVNRMTTKVTTNEYNGQRWNS